jgi:Holliday junction resolvase
VRRAARTDTTHAPIRDGLRELGFSVVDTAKLGKDYPDMIAGKHGLMFWVEAKSPKKVRKTKGDGLSEGQRLFKEEWKGPPVIVAEDLQSVLFAFHLITKRVGWST